MAERGEQYRHLWDTAQQLSVDAADGFFAEVDQAAATGGLPAEDAGTLQHVGFRSLQEATAGDAAAARPAIMRRLLPLCVTEPGGGEPGRRVGHQRLRSLLHDWIEQYPDELRTPLRQEVLAEVLRVLRSADFPRPALWTISAVGFRWPPVVDALLQLAGRDDGTGDAAINCWATLGPPPDDRERLVAQVLDRLPRRAVGTFDLAIQELADPRFLPVLQARVSAHPANSGREDTPMAFSLLGRIADRRSGDHDLQDRVWGPFTRFAAQSEEQRREVLFWGTGAPYCDTPRAVGSMLGWLAGGSRQERLLAYHRLEECVRPRQLDGWSAEHSPALLAALEGDATGPAGGAGPSRTVEHYLKEFGWDTALSAGIGEATQWLGRAVADEPNPYARHSIMDLAACLAVGQLPQNVVALVREEFDMRNDDPTFIARLAAAEVCRSAASIGGFDALLHCGFSSGGQPLRSTAAAVGDVAVVLARRGEGEIAEQLLESCERREPLRPRLLAVSGIHSLAVSGLLPAAAASRVVRLAEDESLPAYARAQLVWALGRTCVGQSPAPDLTALLLRLAGQQADPDSELRFRSLEALIRLGLWREHVPLFVAALNLHDADGSAGPVAPERYEPWQGYLLAQLATESPERFAAAAARVVLKGSGDVAHQTLLSALIETHDEPQRLVPDAIATSLIERIRWTHRRWFGDTEAFGILARISPGRLVATDWSNVWGEWMPEGRAALADALGRLPAGAAKGDAHGHVLRLLEGLLGDSAYAVRRSAARSFSRVEPSLLAELCDRWVRSGQTDLLRRAAEAAGWLPADHQGTLDNEILRRLQTDPEPSVRTAAAAAGRSARRRVWAGQYLGHVAAAADQSNGNDSVLPAYRFGRALVRVGDDETIGRLADLAGARDLPPNVRHWLRRTAKELERRWRDAVRKWPEPMSPWSGALEEVDGTVAARGKAIPTRLSLWLRRQRDPDDVAGWGGAFRWGEPFAALRAASSDDGDKLSIEISGRRAATAWISSARSDGTVTFVGTGPYPEHAE